MVGLLGISECPWSHPWSYPWSYWSTKIYQLHSAALSCTQLHSAASFLQQWGQVCSIHHLRVLLCGLLLAWHPGTPMIWNDLKWSEMIWNDLKWSEVSRPPNHASLMFFDDFLKTMESLRDITTWYYNDWTTGNMNSVSFTKTLENFDMESQKLGFRAVPTGNGNFWGTGVRCTGVSQQVSVFGNEHVTCLP